MGARKCARAAVALVVAMLVREARADYVVYDLGALGKVMATLAGAQSKGLDLGKDTKITLPGKAVVNGQVLSYSHPNGTKVHFKLGEVKHIKAPSAREECNKMMSQAGKDPEAIMKAGIWALKKGQLNELYKAVDKVLDIEPTHEAALKVLELKKTMKEPLPENPETEKKFKSLVKVGGMRFETSPHFLLMTDTPTKPAKGKRKTRARERLDLLEKVYESFLLLFHAQDIPLDIPRERMMVVLFEKYDDFQSFAGTIGPELRMAAGFWEPIRNVSYFYDFGTDDTFKLLNEIMKEMRDVMKDAKKAKDAETIRYVQVLELLMDVERENSDINVVSHECTHQMAGNTGLFPRHIYTPRWVHEGLASYFENPSDGTWAGIGAVSARRMQAYRELSPQDKMIANLNFVVRDEVFHRPISPEIQYGLAWGLTHFMVEKHLKEFVAYYRILGDLPPDVRLNPELLQSAFERVFGSDTAVLETEWHAHMGKLKTELEKIDGD